MDSQKFPNLAKAYKIIMLDAGVSSSKIPIEFRKWTPFDHDLELCERQAEQMFMSPYAELFLVGDENDQQLEFSWRELNELINTLF